MWPVRFTNVIVVDVDDGGREGGQMENHDSQIGMNDQLTWPSHESRVWTVDPEALLERSSGGVTWVNQ